MRIMNLISAALAAYVFLASTQGRAEERRPDAVSEIGRMFAAGEIDYETSLLYKLYFLKAPRMLPEKLRGLPAPGIECGTFITKELHDAYPTLSSGMRKRMDPLLAPPDVAGYIESTRHPIRINYRIDSQRRNAEQLLPFFEQSWDVEVGEIGWYEPLTNFDRSRIVNGANIFIGPTGMGSGGYTDFYSWDYRQTEWSDCSTYIVIDEGNPPDAYYLVAAHEFNHSCQAATDCSEAISFWEATATFTESKVNRWDPTIAYFMYYFQKYPYYSIDYEYSSFDIYDERTYYKYGMCIFPFFMDEHYGDGDGVFVRRVWQNSMQNSWRNEPDWEDALVTTIEEYGGSDNFDDAYNLFAEWRFFTGRNDDGNHFRDGGDWRNTEVAQSGFYYLENLPVRNAKPDQPPQDFGANYFEVNTNKATEEDILRFQFEGDTAVRWVVKVLKFSDGGMAKEDFEPDEDGELKIDLTGIESLENVLFIVVNLGDGLHDPDEGDWVGADYTYSLILLRTPKIVGLQPPRGFQGVKDLDVSLTGSHFIQGDEYTVGFSGGGIDVKDVRVALETKMKLVIDIAPDAVEGMRDVEITTSAGQTVKEVGAFEVYALPAPVVTSTLPEWAEPGTENLKLWIYGQNFFEGPGMNVALSGEEIEVGDVALVDAGTLHVKISIAADAAKGPRDVTVTNPDEKTGTGTGVFHVGKPSEEKVGGCGCGAAGDRGSGRSGLIGLLLLAAAASLRKRAPKTS